jgi:hypothetical protein
LDQALSNVIQNLIRIEDTEPDENISTLKEVTSFENGQIFEHSDARNNNEIILKTDFGDEEHQFETSIPELWDSSSIINTTKQSAVNIDVHSIEKISPSNPQLTSTITNIINTRPIFAIGPLPTVSSPSMKSVQFSNPLIMGPSNRFISSTFHATIGENSTSNADIFSSLASSSLIISSNEKEGSIRDKKQQVFKLIENVTNSDKISVDSFSSFDTVKEFSTTILNAVSSSTSIPKKELQEKDEDLQKETMVASIKSRTPEEVLAARADRLKCLEEQADWLVKKMNATNKRGTALCTKLEELHDTYGEPPVPPPMPDVLPSYKLPSSLLDIPCQVKT